MASGVSNEITSLLVQTILCHRRQSTGSNLENIAERYNPGINIWLTWWDERCISMVHISTFSDLSDFNFTISQWCSSSIRHQGGRWWGEIEGGGTCVYPPALKHVCLLSAVSSHLSLRMSDFTMQCRLWVKAGVLIERLTNHPFATNEESQSVRRSFCMSQRQDC
jgi:hypothetical protein